MNFKKLGCKSTASILELWLFFTAKILVTETTSKPTIQEMWQKIYEYKEKIWKKRYLQCPELWAAQSFPVRPSPLWEQIVWCGVRQRLPFAEYIKNWALWYIFCWYLQAIICNNLSRLPTTGEQFSNSPFEKVTMIILVEMAVKTQSIWVDQELSNYHMWGVKLALNNMYTYYTSTELCRQYTCYFVVLQATFGLKWKNFGFK